MNKILKSTSRGQVTLPKAWREQFDTQYFEAHITEGQLVMVPVLKKQSLNEILDESWQQYLNGEYISFEELKGKYGL